MGKEGWQLGRGFPPPQASGGPGPPGHSEAPGPLGLLPFRQNIIPSGPPGVVRGERLTKLISKLKVVMLIQILLCFDKHVSGISIRVGIIIFNIGEGWDFCKQCCRCLMIFLAGKGQFSFQYQRMVKVL